MEAGKQKIANAIFVGVPNTWPTPEHPECQHAADLVIRGLNNAGLALVKKTELENLRGRAVDSPEDW